MQEYRALKGKKLKSTEKLYRILEIFFRGICGEELSVKELADEYHVSRKSITRDFSEIKLFLAEHRELVGNTEMVYSYKNKTHRMHFEDFLESRDIYIIIKILLGTHAFSKEELNVMINKLKQNVTVQDRHMIELFIRKELFHYKSFVTEQNVAEPLWELSDYISEQKELTITYLKADGSVEEHRICPVNIFFSETCFYLEACFFQSGDWEKEIYRIDRIQKLVVHRERLRKTEK